MDAARIWRGDDPKRETTRRLMHGFEVSSHGGVFSARMDTTGMVREIHMGDIDRKYVVNYVSVSDYIESLSEWTTPDRGVAIARFCG